MAQEERAGQQTTDRLFNFRPAFFSAVFLIFGIVFGYYKILHGVSAGWLLSLLPLAVAPFFFCRNKKDFLKRGGAILLLACFFMVGFIGFRYQLHDYRSCAYYKGEYTVTGTVVERQLSGENAKLVLDRVYIDGKEEKGVLNAYLPASFCKKVRIADKVVVEGYVRTKTEYFGGYGFRANDIDEGVQFTLDYAEGYAVSERSDDIFLLIRRRVERVVYTGMDETAASVTLGVLLGSTSGIEDGLLQNMRMGGIAHIFAVSGLHVGALYAFCLLLFSKTRLKYSPKPFRFFLLAGMLLFYAGICGFSASIVRATVFCLVGYFMRLLGVKSDGLNVLGLAAIVILLFSPVSVFEIGFQLSFMACVGILLFAKRMGQVCDEVYKRYRKRFPRRLTEEEQKTLDRGDTLPLSVGEQIGRGAVFVLCASIAAQITTTPLSYLAFGYLSGWSLLLNFIFVPLISGVFAVLLVIIVVACLLPISISAYLLYLPSMVWTAILLIFEVADFSVFALTGMQLSGGSCVCYYGGVCLLSDKLNISKRRRVLLSCVFFLAFGVILALLNL